MSRDKPCTCLLCAPIEGKRAHPQYGYDLDAVPAMLCLVCNEAIGEEPYVEELWLARFGDMMFVHARCETEDRVKERKRMEARWNKRQERKHGGASFPVVNNK